VGIPRYERVDEAAKAASSLHSIGDIYTESILAEKRFL